MTATLPTFRVAFHSFKAFTLVEVVIVLSIASFSILGMIGLLSLGFQNSHTSIRRDLTTFIARSLLDEAQLAGFSNLDRFTGITYSFDDQGNPCLQADNREVYRATVRITSLPQSASFSPASRIASNLVVDVWGIAQPDTPTRMTRLIIVGN